MNTETIKVENLKCNGCASTIKKGLLKLEGISAVTIDIESSIVKVDFKGDNQDVEILKTKLAKMGYPEVGQNSNFAVAKSYYSCAVGRFGE